GATAAGPNQTTPTQVTVATVPVTASSSTSPPVTMTTMATTTTAPDGSYSAATVTEFMDLCGADFDGSVCSCLLAEIEGTVTETELVDSMAGAYTAADTALMVAIGTCDPDPGSGEIILANYCTNEAWGFKVAYPEDWYNYESSDSAEACRSYSPTGFEGWTPEEIADSPVVVWVAPESAYSDLIDGLVSGAGIEEQREVVLWDRTGWLFDGEYLDAGGDLRSFHSYVLPLWPDMDWGPAILFEAGGVPDSEALETAIAVIDAMVEAAVINPYSP
ncbi:MAG: hypothetical protein MUP76_09600, partial [Acidimicrobiia bacterium]|nr:hypothetical protein [Acidimicrobiia bacterium]